MSYEMYKEIILDEYKNPSNFGEMEKPSHTAHLFNASCGDEFIIQLIVKDDIVTDIKFMGSGCAISTASCSLFFEEIKGKSVKKALALSKDDVLQMLGIPVSDGRMKCALFSFDLVHEALK